MLSSNWTPSIVPGRDRGQDACLVIDDLGNLGLIYCESDVETADIETSSPTYSMGNTPTRSA
jgi:hypothetical protein